MIFNEYTPREYAIKLAINAIDEAIAGDYWTGRREGFGQRVEMRPSDARQVRDQLAKLRESLADKAPALAMHLD
jgi:hypothetical protein